MSSKLERIQLALAAAQLLAIVFVGWWAYYQYLAQQENLSKTLFLSGKLSRVGTKDGKHGLLASFEVGNPGDKRMELAGACFQVLGYRLTGEKTPFDKFQKSATTGSQTVGRWPTAVDPHKQHNKGNPDVMAAGDVFAKLDLDPRRKASASLVFYVPTEFWGEHQSNEPLPYQHLEMRVHLFGFRERGEIRMRCNPKSLAPELQIGGGWIGYQKFKRDYSDQESFWTYTATALALWPENQRVVEKK